MIEVLCLVAAVGTDATWNTAVAPFMETACVQCHHDEGEAPFSLQRATDVRSRARFVLDVIEQGVMPPRAAHGGLVNAPHVDDAQRAMLAAWIDADMPVEDDAVIVSAPSSAAGGTHRTATMAEAWTIPAEGGENWGRRTRDKRSFVLPLHNREPLRVTALHHVPSARGAAHGATFAFDTEARGRWLDEREAGAGYRMMGDMGWQPSGAVGAAGIGARHVKLPTGFCWAIPAHSDLIMEAHFRPDGRPHALNDTVRLYTSDDESLRPLRTLVSMVRALDVPVDATATVEDTMVLEHDVDLVSVLPRATGVCTSMTLTATTPDDRTIELARINPWDPHWRRLLMLPVPVRLPAGTTVHAAWTLANTLENPRNPFVPLQPYTVAARTGAVAWLLHVAAVDGHQDAALESWGVQRLQDKQRTR